MGAPSPHAATERLAGAQASGDLANGFSVDMLLELVREGLASAEPERLVSGGKQIEVARVRITEAGRKVLDGTRL
jgi:hypothetical protein